jgi:formiminotetrahydrofolate cyclodeaminase
LAADRIDRDGVDRPPVAATRLAELARRAAELRERSLISADDDATSYARVLRAPVDVARADALSDASDVPLALAELAAELGEAADEVVGAGPSAYTADVTAASELAAAAARIGADLVATNLAADPADGRIACARAAAGRAERASRSVREWAGAG